jgi:hypothetical protein
MKKYNTLYKKVQDDTRMIDAGAFSEIYKVHRKQLSGKKRKIRKNDGDQSQQLTISNDLVGELLTTLDSTSDNEGGSAAVKGGLRINT